MQRLPKLKQPTLVESLVVGLTSARNKKRHREAIDPENSRSEPLIGSWRPSNLGNGTGHCGDETLSARDPSAPQTPEF